ncbi:MAG: cohesin domain-containing protein, partial [Bacteroidales bacterium]|nr:cohesin domain-containing protein [Bacteroidales bacterium]
MTRTIIKTLMLWGCAICLLPAHAQSINTKIVAQTTCNTSVSVPVVVTNCNGVGAVSLKLNYNSNLLTYAGYQNAHTALSSGLLSISANTTRISISWAGSTPFSIGNDTLLWLQFTGVPGTSTMSWDTQTPGSCEYSDGNGQILAATYTNGNIVINQLPSINVQPVDKVVLNGLATSFSVSASGTGLTYRWQMSTNGGITFANTPTSSPYSGTTGATLNINPASLAMNSYQYRCFVGGTCPPAVLSDAGLLTVIEPVVTSITGFSTCPDTIIIPVNVTNFTDIGAFSLVLTYNGNTLNFLGTQNLNPALSAGSFVANSTGNDLFLSWSAQNAATFGNGTLLELLFVASTGTSTLNWDTQTAGFCEYSDGNGTILNTLWQNGSMTVHALPQVTNQPADRTIAMTQQTIFAVSASGTGLTYRWQVSTDGGLNYSNLSNGGHYSGTTGTTLTVSNAALVLSGNMYRCAVSGTCQTDVLSAPATLTVLTNIITTCPSYTVCPGITQVAVTLKEFSGIGAASLALSYNTAVLSYSGFQNVHPALSGGLFSVNAAGGKVYISWSHTQPATIPYGDTLVELVFNSAPGTSPLTWDTQTPGNCEYSMTNGQIVYSTWVNGSLTFQQPPVINTQPVNKTIYGLGSTTFSVSASGTGLNYRWQVSTDGGNSWNNLNNGSPYSGVTTNTLTVNPAIETMNGFQYRCFVFGTCAPPATSTHALLTVTTTAVVTSVVNTAYSCAGVVNLPINVANCNNVGGISLVLKYDTTKLIYQGYNSAHPQLNGGLLIVNNTQGKIYISWASTTPAFIANGILLKLNFIANVGTSTTLTWNNLVSGNCEYSDPQGNIITSLYNNGTINVTNVYPVYTENANAFICQGDTLVFGTQLLTTAGVYTETFSSVQGCDSTVTLTLGIYPLPVLTCTADTSSCVNQTPYLLQGAMPAGGAYSGTGVDTGYFNPAAAGLGNHVLAYTYTDGNQCTNTCSFNMQVKPMPIVSCPADFSISMNAPPLTLTGGLPTGGTYSGPGVTANVFFPSTVPTGNNTLTYTYQDPVTLCFNSCDFTAYVYDPSLVACLGNLVVCIDDGAIMLNQGIPAGGTYSGNGVSGTTFDPQTAGQGTHAITYNYDNGLVIGQCSFTITVTIPFVHHDYMAICQNDSTLWRGQFYSLQGIYYDSLVANYGGCDSVFVLHLTINQTFEFTENIAMCQGDTYIWRGNSYSTTGTYYDSQSTVHGCDSVFVLQLTVNPVFGYSENASVCSGNSYLWHGQSYTVTGTYYDSLHTMHGCDSIFVLYLTVNPTYEFTENTSICNGGSYSWHGQNLSTQGTYYDSLSTVLGCDSVYVLHLTVNPVYEFIENADICNGATYLWHGQNLSTQGTYYDSLSTVQGCDSVYILNLTVHPTYEFTENAAICNGDSYNWHGQNLSTQGSYYDSLSTVQGCDSVYILNLTVHPTYEFTENAAICNGAS